MIKQNDDNNKYMTPAAPAMPPTTSPTMPMMPPCMFPPPGTVYNPIGVPPWAGMQPSTPPSATLPIQPLPTPPSTSRPPTGTVPQPGPPVLRNTDYIQGYLKTVIGRPVKVEFILGTNMFIDREGILVDVGIDHIVIRETRTDDLLVCDLYSIKFVTVFY